jgi:hypothetical protein
VEVKELVRDIEVEHKQVLVVELRPPGVVEDELRPLAAVGIVEEELPQLREAGDDHDAVCQQPCEERLLLLHLRRQEPVELSDPVGEPAFCFFRKKKVFVFKINRWKDKLTATASFENVPHSLTISSREKKKVPVFSRILSYF